MSASKPAGNSTDDLAIDAQTCTKVLRAIADQLDEYAFPEVAKKIRWTCAIASPKKATEM